MQFPSSLRSVPWRAVAGLLLAGLLGWLAAWVVLPPAAPPVAGPTDRVPTAPTPTPPTPALAAQEMASAARTESAAPRQTFEQLLRQQDRVSESASRSAAALSAPQRSGVVGAPSAGGPASAASAAARDAARAERIKAMRELQTKALADVQAVPAGDVKGLMAAMGRFDAQMRAAGAPALIDMENLRKALEATDRLQQLNRQLIAEAEKGRNADPAKVKALSQEIQLVQASQPRQFIKTEALQKQLAP